MDDLIIVLLEWLFKSLSGKGKATSGPMVRPGLRAPVRPAVPMNRPAPPGLPGVPNRPLPPTAGMPMNRAVAARPGAAPNRPLPPNVRRVVIPANRRPQQRRVAGPPPLPGQVGQVQSAGVLSVSSAARPAPAAKAPAPVARPANAGTWISASVRPEALRRQIIINEILQPPLALREPEF